MAIPTPSAHQERSRAITEHSQDHAALDDFHINCEFCRRDLMNMLTTDESVLNTLPTVLHLNQS